MRRSGQTQSTIRDPEQLNVPWVPQSRYAEAEPLFKRVLAILEQVGGKRSARFTHSDVVVGRTGVGSGRI